MASLQAQGKIAELIGRTQTAPARSEMGEVADIDIENASLEDVPAHTKVMNARWGSSPLPNSTTFLSCWKANLSCWRTGTARPRPT